jgi:hypothetical protein
MPPFLYRCPNTGDNVQAWAADDPEDDDFTYVQVTCLACAQAHLVNPKTGKVLGAENEQWSPKTKHDGPRSCGAVAVSRCFGSR